MGPRPGQRHGQHSTQRKYKTQQVPGTEVSLHDDALALLRPRVVLLVRRVDQGVVLLVLLHVLPHPGTEEGTLSVPRVHEGNQDK